MSDPKNYFNLLNQEYMLVHREKEDLFWNTYMATSDDHAGAATAETKWTEFLSNANRISEVRDQLAVLAQEPDSDEKNEIEHGLKGWLKTFETHAIESKEGQELKAELIQTEASLFEKRQHHETSFVDAEGNKVAASVRVLASNIKASDNEQVRKSSHQGLLDLEQWVLGNGFIELVQMRNQFARSMGYKNFFDYSVEKTEQMTTDQLFLILDDFEQRTRKTNLNSIKALAEKFGDTSVEGHNFLFTWGGDSLRELDPYVPFSKSLRRWAESFSCLNIDYAGADLTLDLLDRKGKYQNGFCHGPIPSYYDNGNWVSAKVNFTSNAKPDQIGSGYEGILTLFHEGGHAAHFANVSQNSPCFSQEFAPTSMAYAETQSMFCDSLLSDGDWLKTYAKDSKGNPVPDSVIKTLIEGKQPFSAYEERSILVVPYFERAIYRLEDHELTAENLTELARETELKILGLQVGSRPLLAIPHLLSNESACSYQGYLLANMAVYQTRAYLTEEYGYLTDNPNIGPLLSKHYWNPGNSINHNATIVNLTGQGFNAKYLADACNQTVEQAWTDQLSKIESLKNRPPVVKANLNAKISIVDGDKLLSSNSVSVEDMCDQFEKFIETQYGR